jgi:hypothetical protein
MDILILAVRYIHLYSKCCYIWLTFWCQKTSGSAQCDAENTRSLKRSAKNVQSNGWPFELLVFCTEHWALNSDARGLIHIMIATTVDPRMNGLIGQSGWFVNVDCLVFPDFVCVCVCVCVCVSRAHVHALREKERERETKCCQKSNTVLYI